VKQVGLLTDYAKDLDRSDRQLAVHIMLDADEAGRRGAVYATVKLLDASIDAPGMVAVHCMRKRERGGNGQSDFLWAEMGIVGGPRSLAWFDSAGSGSFCGRLLD
jgi:hypothetical protein